MNRRDLVKLLKIETRPYINGEYISAKSSEYIEKNSSFDGSGLPPITACGEEDVDLAVQSAKRAFEDGIWKNTSLEKKKKILMKLSYLIMKNKEELALLDTYETGRAYKNYYEDSIPKAIEAIQYFAESIDKYYDALIPRRHNNLGMVMRVPLGVVALITPWNDPLVVSSWKFAPALLMGNSVIIKPAEQSTLSILKIAQLTKEAGIPDGVFNVVPGYGEIAGKALALHKDVRGVFFTGSSQVGKLIMQYAGLSNMKKVGLECGGKGPFIVTGNCKNIKSAAKTLADNMFYNQGQICSAPSRVILSLNIFDEFIKYLKLEIERYIPGDPFNDKNNVGCMVSKDQYDKVNNYIKNAVYEGAAIYKATGEKDILKQSCCIQPTILYNVSNTDTVAQEELFGPVVVILTADSVEDAIKIANSTVYGLAGAVWTDDINEAFYLVKNLELGLVHLNSYGNDDNSAPFGGVKESGLGKDKSLYAFDEYSDLKTVWMHFEK